MASIATRKILPTILVPSASAILSSDKISLCEKVNVIDDSALEKTQQTNNQNVMFEKKKGVMIHKRVRTIYIY